MNSPLLKSRLCLVGFCAAILFKFWLAWGTEITDAVDDPHEYVLQILFPANGGLAYPPGTGIIGQLFHALGIPFRLGIEVAFLLASSLVIRALFDWPWKTYLSLGLFGLIIFDPTVTELFSHLYSDEGWLVTTMLGTALFVLAWRDETKPSWPLAALSAFFLGFSTITRSVFVPLTLALIAFTAISIILLRSRRNQSGAGRTLATFALGLWTLFLGIFALYEGTCVKNSRIHSYFGISAIDNTEYKNFYLCLASVGDSGGDRYYIIDQNRRNLIARAGPLSQWLMTQLDHNEHYKKVGLEHYGKADIPSGWFEFAVFNAALPAAHDDLRQCYALFAAIEKEIADANRLGIIPVRHAIPLPDNRLSIVLPTYPGALRHAIDRILYVPPATLFIASRNGKRYEDPDFSTALLRRDVHESPARETTWLALRPFYALVYTPALAYLALALATVFPILLIMKTSRIESFPLAFLARQFFAILFITLVLWYALFDASGRPVVARYMIFNHLLLVPLIFYYLRIMVRLVRNQPQAALD